MRYRRSERDRKHVQRYSPKAGQAGEFTLGTKRRRSIVDQVHFSLDGAYRATNELMGKY